MDENECFWISKIIFSNAGTCLMWGWRSVKILVQHFVLNFDVGLKQPLFFRSWSHFYSESVNISRDYPPLKATFFRLFSFSSKLNPRSCRLTLQVFSCLQNFNNIVWESGECSNTRSTFLPCKSDLEDVAATSQKAWLSSLLQWLSAAFPTAQIL